MPQTDTPNNQVPLSESCSDDPLGGDTGAATPPHDEALEQQLEELLDGEEVIVRTPSPGPAELENTDYGRSENEAESESRHSEAGDDDDDDDVERGNAEDSMRQPKGRRTNKAKAKPRLVATAKVAAKTKSKAKVNGRTDVE